jgi:hypothetical protein
MPRLSDTFSIVTVVMLTTAGVTTFATSVNPFDGVVLIVRATGVGVAAAGLDAWEVDNDWPLQIRRALSAATAMTLPIV